MNSPKWAFDDALYARSAASFENPDHVNIVIHNYRWRLSTDGTAYAHLFTGKRTHRIIKGVGHNLPQEAPRAFAEAVVEVDSY